jgi:hypothetical protein
MTAEIAVVITAIATLVYGFATLLLWLENREDRKHRDKHFREEAEARKRNELYRAFYDAWGYWKGHVNRSFDSRTDALQAGAVFEAFIRFECQLRLNGFTNEANNLEETVREDLHAVMRPLRAAGIAIGLLPGE